MSKRIFEEGDRVRLRAVPEENLPAELATVLGRAPNGTYTVEVDEALGPDDDRLRDVPEDQVEEL
jgi:precorrin-6B methylase 1